MRVRAAQQLPESSSVTHLFIWQGFPLHLNNRGTLPRGKLLFASLVCYIISCVTSPPGQNLVARDPQLVVKKAESLAA